MKKNRKSDGYPRNTQNIQLVSELYESGITGKTSYHVATTAEETEETAMPEDIVFTSTDPEWTKQQD